MKRLLKDSFFVPPAAPTAKKHACRAVASQGDDVILKSTLSIINCYG